MHQVQRFGIIVGTREATAAPIPARAEGAHAESIIKQAHEGVQAKLKNVLIGPNVQCRSGTRAALLGIGSVLAAARDSKPKREARFGPRW